MFLLRNGSDSSYLGLCSLLSAHSPDTMTALLDHLSYHCGHTTTAIWGLSVVIHTGEIVKLPSNKG